MTGKVSKWSQRHRLSRNSSDTLPERQKSVDEKADSVSCFCVSFSFPIGPGGSREGTEKEKPSLKLPSAY